MKPQKLTPEQKEYKLADRKGKLRLLNHYLSEYQSKNKNSNQISKIEEQIKNLESS